jgi:molybdate transport system permease protein
VTPLRPEEWEALLLSAKVGLAATVVALPFGILFAWLLARREFPGRTLVETTLSLPLVLPPVVTGYFLLVVLGGHGVLGRFFEDLGFGFAFTWRGAAVASGVLGFPLMVRTIQVAIAAVDPGLEGAARSLGAGPRRVFFTITLPLARAGVLSGAILAFARSVGEFGATITFVGNIPGETRTLPLAIYALLQTPGGEAAAARLGILSALLAATALFFGEWIRRRAARRELR